MTTLTLVDEQLEQLIGDVLRDAGVVVRVAFRRTPAAAWEFGQVGERGAFTDSAGRRLIEVIPDCADREALVVPIVRDRWLIQSVVFPHSPMRCEGRRHA